MLEVAARYHIEAEAIGGTEFPEAEVVRGRAAYHQHFLPNMWDANVRRLRISDPELFTDAANAELCCGLQPESDGPWANQ